MCEGSWWRRWNEDETTHFHIEKTMALVLENWNMLMIENGKFTISLLYWIAKEELDEHQQTLRRMSGGRWNI